VFAPLDRARFEAAVDRATHAPLAKLAATASTILQLAPNDLDALSIAGSMSFLNGDAAGGQRFLGRAFELNPGNPEVRLQLATGLLETKQFQRAEALFAQGATPLEVVDRAACVLLEGDVARANSIMNSLLQAQTATGNALASLSRAEWTAATGALQDAISLLRSTSWPAPQTQALARAHAAIWLALLNKTGDADLQIAGSGSGAGSAVLLAYQTFLRADYKAAEQQWRAVENASGGADLRSRAMLASCLDHLGRTSEIAALKVEPFVPNLSGTDPFSVIPFLEMRRLLHLKL
jgi:thioredoxin-like negative regulator of GroEL